MNHRALCEIMLLVGVGLVGCQPEPAPLAITRVSREHTPAVDIPRPWRMTNWAFHGEGSCVHASLVTLLHWQEQHRLAQWWQAAYAGAEHPQRLSERLNRAGVRFAEVRTGDVRFLEWAVRTHRGCAVTVERATHMVCLVHLDARWAGLVDSNAPQQIRWVPRREFLADWTSGSLTWAVTPVYVPPPPYPDEKESF